MCIIGCAPKRAGQAYISKLYKDPNSYKEIAKKMGIRVKTINMPSKLIYSYQGKEKAVSLLKNKVNKEFLKVDNYLFQGCVVIVHGPNREKCFHFVSDCISSLNNNFRCSCLVMQKRIEAVKIKIIFIFSRKNDICSYLYGNRSFSMAHWFVEGKSPLLTDIDNKTIDKHIKLVNLQNIADAKKLKKTLKKSYVESTFNNKQITSCIFCTERIFREFYSLRKIAPEILWTIAREELIIIKKEKFG